MAAPVIYVYVLSVQIAASMIGETIPLANFVSAALVILGVYVLSRGGGSKPKARGIAFAFTGALAWTAGQDLVALATSAGRECSLSGLCEELSGCNRAGGRRAGDSTSQELTETRREGVRFCCVHCCHRPRGRLAGFHLLHCRLGSGIGGHGYEHLSFHHPSPVNGPGEGVSR